MSPSTSTPKLSPNAETVLLHLADARAPKDRTKTAIKDACGLNGLKADAALTDLLLFMMVEESDGAYLLTEAGRGYARRKRDKKTGGITYVETQNNVRQSVGKVENSSVNMSTVKNASAKTAGGKADVTATPVNFSSLYSMSPSGEIGIDKTLETGTLPYLSALSHPARSNSAPPKHAETDRVGPIPNVRFLLAFTSLSGSLPIPVFDQDKLGRSRENQISLPHDVYLSHSHCRFTIKRNKTTGAYEFYIEDLASRNGTTVGNAQIEPHKPVQLKHGTKVEIGGLSFVVVEVPMGS